MVVGRNAAKRSGNKASLWPRSSHYPIREEPRGAGDTQTLEERALRVGLRDNSNGCCVLLRRTLHSWGQRHSLLFSSGCKQADSSEHLGLFSQPVNFTRFELIMAFSFLFLLSLFFFFPPCVLSLSFIIIIYFIYFLFVCFWIREN